MVKRKVNFPDTEPDEKTYSLPSVGEHLMQVVDIYDINNNPYSLNLDEDTVTVKCEVVGGEEEGRSLLHRLTLNQDHRGFFATRLFLKSIGLPHKGKGIDIDTDFWVGEQFNANVIHDGKYANIDTYNFDKEVVRVKHEPTISTPEEEKAWDS